MKICFLDKTPFFYNSSHLNSPILRGAETALINLASTLNNLGHDITVINNCPKNETISNINWININSLDTQLIFDLAISNNDCRFFDKVISNKKILMSHSIQSFEKFLRKNQFFSYFKHKPKVALLGNYHKKKRSFLTRCYGFFYLDYGVDNIFIKTKIDDNFVVDKDLAIFTSRPDRNLDLLIDIWKSKIYPKYSKGKLLVTPTKKPIDDCNIFFRKLLDRENLIKDLSKSRILLIPGHKAELYCLAAEEARELCVPIITLGLGSLSERVQHGKTGFIAKNINEFAKYTLEIFSNDSLWNDLRSNLIKLRGSKSWMKCSKNLIENI